MTKKKEKIVNVGADFVLRIIFIIRITGAVLYER